MYMCTCIYVEYIEMYINEIYDIFYTLHYRVYIIYNIYTIVLEMFLFTPNQIL